LIWAITTAIAIGPIEIRPDDLPRNENGFSIVEKWCGDICSIMDYPFLSISPGHGLDGPQGLALLALFWGIILYFIVLAVVRVIQAQASSRIQ
jgi:hypothetical protein